MHLEDVNICGFKSFSEATTMSFQPGIGVIIGNNGVGKSNILDAIVWAMGETDITRIRCYEMGELFFAGSHDYPPAETASVELHFKSAGSPDTAAVRFARELDRKGSNRYYRDGAEVPEIVYREQLAAHGLRHALKTIIRQEEINDLMSLNPWDRWHALGNLLGIQSEEALERCIRERFAPLFKRYMAYLMPLADVRLDGTSQAGPRGFDILVNLPGNRRRRAHQLSGGEKAITSLAVKLALFSQLDTPFYLMDEVEPSLDYVNHKSMQALLKEISALRQLVMITHLRSTIELADTVHGVRTRFDGSSYMKFYFMMDERLLRLYKCC